MPERGLNILILYDEHSLFTMTVKEYLEAFYIYSKNYIYYLPATHDNFCHYDLEFFDVIVLHYSIRLSFKNHISPYYADGIVKYKGYKILFVQDEYDNTETLRKAILNLGIHTVFTCVPQKYVPIVYPPARFKNTEFIPILTGYVPESLEKLTNLPKLIDRSYIIGYRGRILPYWYGSLAQEKCLIGQKMKAICKKRKIKVNIMVDDKKRIYGDKWYKFLQNTRTTLGTESGSNIFDDDGTIRRTIQDKLKLTPSLTFSDIYDSHIAPYEKDVVMNQISPKIFEAIACRTGLILFEGNYSGIVKADIHYIPLKKDFSNVDEVLEKVNDIPKLEEMVEKAHADIIASRKCNYKSFIAFIDNHIDLKISKYRGNVILTKKYNRIDPSQITMTKLFECLIYKCKEATVFSSKKTFNFYISSYNKQFFKKLYFFLINIFNKFTLFIFTLTVKIPYKLIVGVIISLTKVLPIFKNVFNFHPDTLHPNQISFKKLIKLLSYKLIIAGPRRIKLSIKNTITYDNYSN